jgi:hypothetical protein
VSVAGYTLRIISTSHAAESDMSSLNARKEHP